MHSKIQMPIGILTAISEEFVIFDRVLKSQGWEFIYGQNRERKSIELWQKNIDGNLCSIEVGFIDGMGQTIAAIKTAEFIRMVVPDIVILCGIAGSLKKDKCATGDVVVVNNVFWRLYNKISDGENGSLELRRSPKPVPPFNADRMKRLSNFIRRSSPRELSNESDSENDGINLASSVVEPLLSNDHSVHFEPIFTSDFVISSRVEVADINKSFPEAFCAEMEAAGFLLAVQSIEHNLEQGRNDIPAFIVRGISDYADSKDQYVESEEENASIALKNRKIASENAALVTVKLAESMFRKDKLNFYGEFRQS